MEIAIEKILADIERYKTVEEVILVAVTKTRTDKEIAAVLAAGILNLGENKAQEIRDKSLVYKDASWHMIGRLQKNKLKYLIGKVMLIHSVADVEMLVAIKEHCENRQESCKILLQINPSGEKSKQGFSSQQLEAVLKEYENDGAVKIAGLMCMAPYTEDTEVIEQTFARAKKKYDIYNDGRFEYLSMGMSNDYVIALKHGSNMLRIGSRLFEE
ncbi:YggS family pyridoxal phosphate enzyme [Erysipelotrichaceae bacterium]|nr:YggS family pyridoxal phosphate enzyme [Erysipelotrichaceae bacterium]